MQGARPSLQRAAPQPRARFRWWALSPSSCEPLWCYPMPLRGWHTARDWRPPAALAPIT